MTANTDKPGEGEEKPVAKKDKNKTEYSFPELGKTVLASSLEEAQKMVSE